MVAEKILPMDATTVPCSGMQQTESHSVRNAGAGAGQSQVENHEPRVLSK
jgi:hypothetical protein